jgi:hypothetical protein
MPQNFIPRKLVFQDEVVSILPDRHIIAPIDKTVVISHNLHQNKLESDGPFEFLPYAPKSGPMVFIFWSAPSYTSEAVESRRILWNEFQEDIFDGVKSDQYPQEIVFVNVERIAAPDIHELAGAKTLCDYAAEANQEQFNRTLDNHFAPDRRHRRRCCENVEKARNTKFTFVTMRDYLKNWDWAGDLTDEELQPWLESQEMADEGLEVEMVDEGLELGSDGD